MEITDSASSVRLSFSPSQQQHGQYLKGGNDALRPEMFWVRVWLKEGLNNKFLSIITSQVERWDPSASQA